MGMVNVTINPVPTAPTPANNSSLCAGQTLSLSALPNGADSYDWTGPNSFTASAQDPTIGATTTSASGTYSVTQTVLGCTSPAGITNVTINPIPAAPTAANNSSLCAGQTLSLTANPGGADSYSWTGPNTFTDSVQNPTIGATTTSASGTYSVTQTILGCTSPVAITNVTINPIPAAPTAANNSSICAGQTLSLTALPNGADSYDWAGPNTFTSNVQNPVIVGTTTLASGDYTVTQTVLGCTSPTAITSVTVNPIPNPPNGNSNSPVCGGGALIFTLNPPGGIYNWTGPNSFTSNIQSPTISPAPFSATGNYSVTITLLGCTSSVAIIGASVGAIPNPPDISATSPVCAGSSLSLAATFTNGVSYTWSGPNSFTSNVQNPIIIPAGTLAAGVYTAFGDINGCVGPISTVAVVVDTPAIVNAGPRQDTVCYSAIFIPLTGSVTGGGSTGGTWSTLGSGSFSPSNSLATTYSMSPADQNSPSFQLVLTSIGGGCPAQSDTIRFIVLGQPTVNVGTNLNICKNAFVPLSATITGVTNTGTWTSTGTGTFTPNIATLNGYYIPSSTDTSSGQIKLVLESTNNKGCASNRDSLFVTFIPSPVANFTNTNACANKPLDFTDLSAPSPSISSWGWDFGDGSGTSTASNPSYSYAASNVYTVTHVITLQNGCRDTVRKPITVYNSPVANFSVSSVCQGYASNFSDASTISPDTLVAWDWSFGDGNSSAVVNPQNTYSSTGVYNVNFTVTTNKGCSDMTVKTVTVHARPHADFAISSATVLAYENVSFTDQSSPAGTMTSWNWNFGNATSTAQNPNNAFTDKGIYSVTLAVIDNNGCADTAKKDVIVYLLPLVPSAFTPNHDGHNDVLYVKGGPFVNMYFRVYNNWGELIFESRDQEVGWDGTYKGQQAPLGAYVYILDANLYNGTSVRKTGDVTILK
jgi:gliding motility-associated-like protein